MANYYFTVASLPHLSYQMERLLTIDNFFQICEDNLSPIDVAMVKSAKIFDFDNAETVSSVLSDWYVWEKNLRNRLVLLRSKKKGDDGEEYLRETPKVFGGEKDANLAFSQESPLEAEDILNRARWSYLESLEFGHYFDAELLIIYYIKLQLLWHIESYDKEVGSSTYNAIVQRVNEFEIFQSL